MNVLWSLGTLINLDDISCPNTRDMSLDESRNVRPFGQQMCNVITIWATHFNTSYAGFYSDVFFSRNSGKLPFVTLESHKMFDRCYQCCLRDFPLSKVGLCVIIRRFGNCFPSRLQVFIVLTNLILIFVCILVVMIPFKDETFCILA